MKIRKATLADFLELYDLGLSTKELRVSADEPFMDKDDFKLRIIDKRHVFLVAEVNKKIVGFICANTKDIDKPLKNKYACLVYIAVSPEYRRKNIGTKLYQYCINKLKKRAITYVYAWADANSKPVQKFLLKENFKAGEKCIWMDKKI